MDVAVLGATGDVGRQVVTQLVERRVLPTTSRLQLVGRPGGASGRAVHGLRADLVDAYDEHAPLIDVAHSPADVVADVVVVAAGATTPARSGASLDRTGLAVANREVFAEYADAIARQGSGHEVVIVVSNPVEVGVAVMARALGARRVVGMGAWLDTLRFRREIAVELGVRRHRIGGFVGGQHGEDAVPLWSTVRLSGHDLAERDRAVRLLRRGRTLDGFPDEIAAAKAELVEVAATDIGAAYRLIDTWPADLRVVARPWMTHQSGAKTATATASATVDLVEVVLDGREIVVAGQVALDDEVALAGEPQRGVLGVPIVLGPEGWTRVLLDSLPDDETHRLRGAAAAVGSALRTAGVEGGPGGSAAAAAGAADAAERAGSAGAAGADASEGPGEAVRPDAAEPSWVAQVEGLHRAGTLTGLTGVFSTRGVSFEHLATEEVEGDGDAGTIHVSFRASERRARALERAVGRLATVRSVVVHGAPRETAAPPRDRGR
ncbi:lactate dehydrogenase [Oerskovia sp. NPDC057915]|uniref:lactate/malate family dehydrogenase n=1 Tax=Oerskovia sp. NPDC057915 TaxID=3346280 RepID=UPI0036DC518C